MAAPADERTSAGRVGMPAITACPGPGRDACSFRPGRGQRQVAHPNCLPFRALRSLEVPAHRPGFHAELLARLGTTVPKRDTAGQERPARPDRSRRGAGRHGIPSAGRSASRRPRRWRWQR
jgi:hypothetical protein